MKINVKGNLQCSVYVYVGCEYQVYGWLNVYSTACVTSKND